ncbi:MAG: membrane protein insertion efficiency factor YidD [Treponema sp.]|nr:membrane protein insertion efficiency factor YidD [Treponema sp.]
MFHNKRLVKLFIFLITGNVLFAQTRNIQNFQLEFTKTETLIESSVSSTVKGKISYQQNPYAFVFEVTQPEEQLSYLNSKGSYVLENEEAVLVEEQRGIILQVQNDFLNWFRSDYGLQKSGYKMLDFYKKDSDVILRWIMSSAADNPVSYVNCFINEHGYYDKMQMFSALNELLSETRLSGFHNSNGYFYPTVIETVIYEGTEESVKVILTLENVHVNSLYENPYSTGKAVLLKRESVSSSFNKQLVEKPEIKQFKTSDMQIIFGAGYSFYKKFITDQDTSNCPFNPTCSQYMMQSISKYGLFGIMMGFERLSRCTVVEHKRDIYPIKDGRQYDPVPDFKEEKKKKKVKK